MVGRRKAKEPQTAVTGSRFGDAKGQPIPLFVADQNDWSRRLAVLTDEQRNWIAANGVKPASRRVLALPGHDGAVAAIFVAVGDAAPNDPFSQSEIALGLAAAQIRPGAYALAHPVNAPELAAVAFGLGSYRYGRYKSAAAEPAPVLDAPDGADALRIAANVEGVALGRDLINTPSRDMGPADLEQAARTLAERHRAGIATIVGDD